MSRSTLLFTLPMSCQICLAKVKDPVVCSNLHVFCCLCLEEWTKCSQMCPTCRDSFETKPPKKIIGGDNNVENEVGNQSKNSFPSILNQLHLRRARVNIILQEFEEDVRRLVKQQNLIQSQNAFADGAGTPTTSEVGPNGEIKNTTGSNSDLLGQLEHYKQLYRQSQCYVKNLKKATERLREENTCLNRTNDRLKITLSERSPHKYGRYTVAALESKLETLEKENLKLLKALENSDKYIECLKDQVNSGKTSKNLPLFSSKTSRCYKPHKNEGAPNAALSGIGYGAMHDDIKKEKQSIEAANISNTQHNVVFRTTTTSAGVMASKDTSFRDIAFPGEDSQEIASQDMGYEKVDAGSIGSQDMSSWDIASRNTTFKNAVSQNMSSSTITSDHITSKDCVSQNLTDAFKSFADSNSTDSLQCSRPFLELSKRSSESGHAFSHYTVTDSDTSSSVAQSSSKFCVETSPTLHKCRKKLLDDIPDGVQETPVENLTNLKSFLERKEKEEKHASSCGIVEETPAVKRDGAYVVEAVPDQCKNNEPLPRTSSKTSGGLTCVDSSHKRFNKEDGPSACLQVCTPKKRLKFDS